MLDCAKRCEYPNLASPNRNSQFATRRSSPKSPSPPRPLGASGTDSRTWVSAASAKSLANPAGRLGEEEFCGCGLWFGGVHRGAPPPRGYFVKQNIDGTGLRFFGVYPLAKPCRLNAKAQRWLGLVVALCLQYIEGVNRLRGGEVCKWLIWMMEINFGCGQEDAGWGLGLSMK